MTSATLASHEGESIESMKTLVTALVLAAAFTSVVAGCGGGKSAEEEWAGNVCTDVANWQSQVKTATSNISKALQSPGSGTVSTVSTQVQSALDATRELGTNLKGDKPPSTDEGNQAKQQIDSLATNCNPLPPRRSKRSTASLRGRAPHKRHRRSFRLQVISGRSHSRCRPRCRRSKRARRS